RPATRGPANRFDAAGNRGSGRCAQQAQLRELRRTRPYARGFPTAACVAALTGSLGPHVAGRFRAEVTPANAWVRPSANAVAAGRCRDRTHVWRSESCATTSATVIRVVLMTTEGACHVRIKLKQAISRRAHRQGIERRQTAGLLRRRARTASPTRWPGRAAASNRHLT